MSDLMPIIEALGGGLSSVLVVVLGFVGWRLFQRLNEVQDARLADAVASAATSAQRDREFVEVMREMEQAVRDTSKQLQEVRHQVERRNGGASGV